MPQTMCHEKLCGDIGEPKDGGLWSGMFFRVSLSLSMCSVFEKRKNGYTIFPQINAAPCLVAALE